MYGYWNLRRRYFMLFLWVSERDQIQAMCGTLCTQVTWSLLRVTWRMSISTAEDTQAWILHELVCKSPASAWHNIFWSTLRILSKLPFLRIFTIRYSPWQGYCTIVRQTLTHLENELSKKLILQSCLRDGEVHDSHFCRKLGSEVRPRQPRRAVQLEALRHVNLPAQHQ